MYIAPLHRLSPSMQAVYDRAIEAAATDASILILGEDGVGRKTMAHRIHRLSARAARPLEVVYLPALPHSVCAEELVGYAEGAFSSGLKARAGAFERADTGTILLAEFEHGEADMKSAVLRTMETREVIRFGSKKVVPIDVRFIATALHYWVNELDRAAHLAEYASRFDVVLEIPALRERRSEIPELARFFAAQLCKGEKAPTIQPEAMALLEQYSWPSNILSLRCDVERAVVLSGGADIAPQHLPFPKAPGR